MNRYERTSITLSQMQGLTATRYRTGQVSGTIPNRRPTKPSILILQLVYEYAE